MNQEMNREQARIIKLVSYLQWLIPFATSGLAGGYVLFELGIIQGQTTTQPHVLRILLVVSVLGPGIIWLTLNWAKRAMQDEAKARAELASLNEELVILTSISEAVNQSLDMEEILRAALDKLMGVMKLEEAAIWLRNGDQYVLKAQRGMSYEFASRESNIPLADCACSRCTRTGQILSINDLSAEPSTADSACAREGFRSIIAVPMKAGGQIVGLMHTASRQKDAFSSYDLQTLARVNARIATAVQNASLYRQANHRAVGLESASMVAQRMTALLDLNSLLAETAKLVREKFGFYHTQILLVDREVGELVLVESSGPSADLIKARGLRLKIGVQGITGRVAQTGEVMLCNDVSREPSYYPVELLPETQSELAIPLRVADRIVGVLDVQSDHANAFDNDDLNILQVLGSQVGIAIENVRLFQETKRRYNAMVALHETSLDMISRLDREDLLKSLLRRGVTLLESQAGSLSVYDTASELIHIIASYNTAVGLPGTILELGEGVAGQVIETGNPLIVNDTKRWDGRPKFYDETSTYTRMIGAPLKWRDETIGAIMIAKESYALPFGGDELWLLSLFADLATIAIKNAELHTQVKEFGQGLERQVEERTRELSRAKEEIAANAEQLRSLLAKTIHLQEEERARIARDMHDGIIQLITGSRYVLQATKIAVQEDKKEQALSKLSAAREVLDEIEKEIRHSIYDLHPSILDALDFIPALRKLATRFQEVSGIACQVQVDGIPFPLPPPVEIAAFRMAEEALQNAAAHARPTSTSVTLNFQPDLLYMSVWDNGQGFDYERLTSSGEGNHLGLLSMSERAKSLGGELQVKSRIGQGTRLIFRLPVTPVRD